MPREQYEILWKDYYEILQVHPKAEPEVMLAAYRKLAQVYHPDRNKSDLATQKFQEINEAKEVLSDLERRARYDQAYRSRFREHSRRAAEAESQRREEEERLRREATERLRREEAERRRREEEERIRREEAERHRREAAERRSGEESERARWEDVARRHRTVIFFALVAATIVITGAFLRGPIAIAGLSIFISGFAILMWALNRGINSPYWWSYVFAGIAIFGTALYLVWNVFS